MHFQKLKRVQTFALVISAVLLVLDVIAAACVAPLLGYAAKEAIAVTGLVSLAVLLVIPLVNMLLMKKLKNERVDVQGQINELMARRGAAEKSLADAAKRTVRLRRLFNLYCALLTLLVLVCFFALSVVDHRVAGASIVALWLLSPIVEMWLRIPERFDFSGYCDPSEFKSLHALARRAADVIGIEGEIRIQFTLDCNIGIAKIGRVNSLQLGVTMLDVATEDEIYQCLLHEFAHLTKEANLSYRERRLFDKLTLSGEPSMIQKGYFGYIASTFCKECMYYTSTASQSIERLADAAVLRYGNPQVAINALAKSHHFSRFNDEIAECMGHHYYEPETMYENIAEEYSKAFRKAIIERGEFWKELALKELQARIASHPILSSRMEAFGVTDFEVILPDDEGEYRDECNKAKTVISKLIYDSAKDGYAEERENEYVKPKAKIDEWLKNGKPLDESGCQEILDTLFGLGMYELTLETCDRVISESENESFTPHAHFMKGVTLLHLYDKRGIDSLYRAMEINSNYLKAGLNIIGDYCCRNGLQQELDEYRERSMELGQQHEDGFSQLSVLRASDNLSKEEGFPEGMLESILDFIKGIENGSIEKIFLVRKTVSESFFGSVFVVKFKHETDNETIDEVLGKIFTHLDLHPSQWDFSLFLYDKHTEKAVGKVKDCCVYSAE